MTRQLEALGERDSEMALMLLRSLSPRPQAGVTSKETLCQFLILALVARWYLFGGFGRDGCDRRQQVDDPEQPITLADGKLVLRRLRDQSIKAGEKGLWSMI